MRWSKIKNIIILLLLVVNVFLLALVGLRAWRTQQNQRETRERMITVLANNGPTFLPDEVPDRLELSPCRVTLTPVEEDMVRNLIGPITGTRTVGARTTYTGFLGEATFSASGTMDVRFFSGARPLGDDDPDAYAAQLLAGLGVTVQGAGRDAGGVEGAVTYTQFWAGAPVPEQTLTLTWTGGDLTALTGRRLAGTAENLSVSGEAITASTALLRFLEALNREGYVCSQVTGLYAGYAAAGTGTVTLTPVWYVETDAWPWRFTVDGYTGAVTAAE